MCVSVSSPGGKFHHPTSNQQPPHVRGANHHHGRVLSFCFGIGRYSARFASYKPLVMMNQPNPGPGPRLRASSFLPPEPK